MMLGHLSIRTRQIVEQLIQGKSVSLGGNTILPFTGPQKAFLQLAATNLGILEGVKGTDLLTAASDLYDKLPEFVVTATAKELPTSTAQKWRIGTIRTQSFRGIAPAGCVWEYDLKWDNQTPNYLL